MKNKLRIKNAITPFNTTLIELQSDFDSLMKSLPNSNEE